MNKEVVNYYIGRWSSKYNEMKGKYLKSVIERMKLADENERLEKELRMQKDGESKRVHELTIERDAGRKIIKEYIEVLKELEDENKRLHSPPEDELCLKCYERKDAKKTRIRDILFSKALLKWKKGEKE